MFLKELTRGVLTVLHKRGPLTKKELVAYTGYKLTSLNRYLSDLFASGWICNYGKKESTGGRPSKVIGINGAKGSFLGLDISRTYVEGVLINGNLDKLWEIKIELRREDQPDQVVKKIHREWAQIKDAYPPLLGLGLGLVGPFNENTGQMEKGQHFINEAWQVYPFAPKVKEVFGQPVSLESGANLAALGEAIVGKEDQGHLAYVNCGMGIRMGLYFDGVIIQPKGHREDMLGHTVVDYQGLACQCGLRGCVNTGASLFGMAQKIRFEKEKGYFLELETYGQIIEEMIKGEPLCTRLAHEGGKLLGVGLSNYVKAMAIDKVVFSGPLIQASPGYIAAIREEINHQLHPFQVAVDIDFGGQLNHQSMAYGAGVYAMEESLGI